MTCRRIAHVSVEIIEFQPSLTDLDAATAIEVVALLAWIVTPAKHGRPYAVDFLAIASTAGPVSQGLDLSHINAKATTRFDHPLAQVLSRGDMDFAAVANTPPIAAVFFLIPTI
jgi:hypothetical protein